MYTQSKIDIVIEQIKSQIANQRFVAGARLPSVRRLAQDLNFSISTVVEAYARLVTEGVLEARAGSGFYVKGQMQAKKIAEHHVQYDREINPLWISRQSLDANEETLKPGCGWLPPEWMPESSLRKALKHAAKSSLKMLVEYPVPHGHMGLRQWIARKNNQYEIQVEPSQILITDSGTQSIDLIFRVHLKAGDVILVDDPCYFNFQALIQAHRLQAIAIPFTTQGPDIESFEQALQYQPKLYLTNSGIHNPTGATLSIQRAYQVAKLADQANLLIVEDDIFSEFEYVPAPRYSTLMGLGRVIQIGSFSKTLTASLRCGYIVSNCQDIEKYIDLKIATNFSSGHLNAEIVFAALMDSQYLKHIESLKKKLNTSMGLCIQRLRQLRIEPVLIPKAGIFLWCKLPSEIDAAELSRRCLKRGLILAPGHAFSQSEGAKHLMRFNVAQCMNPQIFEIIAQVMDSFSFDHEKPNSEMLTNNNETQSN
ncbi:GntR family transcriptional regulator [Acinetobacter sp. AM]|uniref:aminotransferase-like domain-containing protein n=1 Tax=Acinetobacter sp. AM TaxID=2170730 RepID=UPI000DE6C1C5|nr:PLP-dependent aminotransferase family protein [Acinetobacter sp. AM]PWB14479.1 GntR family transcriptional regulator [Acinetobacter sp. AM]